MSVVLRTFSLLFGAMLIAVQFRLQLPLGEPLPAAYIAQPPALYAILFACSGVIAVLFRRMPFASLAELLAALALSCVLIVALLPDVSTLQIGYFVIAACGLGLFVLVLPAAVIKDRRGGFRESVQALVKHRHLLTIWISSNVQARYSQALLGVLWIILLPLAQALILSLVFSYIIRIEIGDASFIPFFLSALVPWSFFNQSLMNAAGSITGMMGIINQIYFPRELLVLIRLGETAIDTGFMFIALIVISLMAGSLPTWNYLYLPILFALTVCFTLGPALLLGYFTVLIRDIPQLLFVVLQLLFYLTPIMYPLDFYPAELRLLVLLNPLAPLIQAFRDVIAYQHAPDWVSLYFTAVMGVVMVVIGYQYFKANERLLADFV